MMRTSRWTWGTMVSLALMVGLAGPASAGIGISVGIGVGGWGRGGVGVGVGFGYPGYYGGYRYGNAGYYVAPAPVYAPRASFYPPAEQAIPVSTNAKVQVMLPDGQAQVLIDGYKTSSTGVSRLYESPPLEPGKTYTYKLTATWTRDGNPVTEERAVSVTAGSTVVVDFTRPAN